MLYVGVTEDRKSIEKFLSCNDIEADSVFLSAKQGEETVGCVAFSVKDSSADISAISYDDDLFVCELLLRAVANYAERRGITQMTAAFDEPRGPLASLGFRLIDGQMTTAVSNVVHICKNCEEEGK